ncbi:NAD-dependent deacetylase sirtuin-2 [Echinococcus granulosus]|uniref:NAD-dependent protein deacetylase n=1 Tax=Echinococcus granulosus TaxID=6210 RepID=W6UGE3_ECHGR|nr:NAD-dependent deacetylase sirtuin-2 [Echinococcus granulosus]EUB60041.1 NAD-dependent deacetylase sirtuin-2 [Echinococcus granulosus]
MMCWKRAVVKMAFSMESLRQALHLSFSDGLLESLDLEGVAKLIKSGKVRNIITAVGAGISTSAGIPDFRSPSTGIYDNLEEYHLPSPMSVFELSYFEKNPKPFFEVARRLYRPYAKPTTAHYFIKLLCDKGLLLRHYTQNVDQLERISGLPEDKMVEAHGSFHTGHCLECHKEYPFEFFKGKILAKEVPKCTEANCDGVVKPDVVFFGEGLPSKFTRGVKRDFPKCDLLIIMGTSLQVLPFSGIVNCTKRGVPRLYINREYTDGSTSGFVSFIMKWLVAGFRAKPLQWGQPGNKTDVFVKGDADGICLRFADLLEWKDDLLRIQSTRNAELDREFEEERKSSR